MTVRHEFQNALNALAEGGMTGILTDAYIQAREEDKALIEEHLIKGIKTCEKAILRLDITSLLERKGLNDRIFIEALRACGNIGDVKAIAEFNEKEEELSDPVRRQIDESFKTALRVCEQRIIGGAIADIINARELRNKYSKLSNDLMTMARKSVDKIMIGLGKLNHMELARRRTIKEIDTADATDLREKRENAREAEKVVFAYLEQRTATRLAGDGVTSDGAGVMRPNDIPTKRVGLVTRAKRALFG